MILTGPPPTDLRLGLGFFYIFFPPTLPPLVWDQAFLVNVQPCPVASNGFIDQKGGSPVLLPYHRSCHQGAPCHRDTHHESVLTYFCKVST